MSTNKTEIANSFLSRDDLSDAEEVIKARCIGAQTASNQIRQEYNKLVQNFNAVRQSVTEKELELLKAQNHLEALVDLIVDLNTSPDEEESKGDD